MIMRWAVKRLRGTAALNRLVFPIGIITAIVMVLSLIGAASAEEAAEERVQTTDHYKVTLAVGPVTPVWSVDQASEAKEGHFVVNTYSIPMDVRDLIPTVDQGQPVNRLLEVFVYERETGAQRIDLVPRIAVTDLASASSRHLPALAKMYGVSDGPDKPCFGTNAFLDGTYRITVTVGGEPATFEDITVSGASNPPAASDEANATPEN
jgi:hypothetical protein